ncbi:hypothetical protein [Oceanicola sp. D3]|nr:hypothetical protein [Oceanicola sp. D3]
MTVAPKRFHASGGSISGKKMRNSIQIVPARSHFLAANTHSTGAIR